jgi:hypothetical protein
MVAGSSLQIFVARSWLSRYTLVHIRIHTIAAPVCLFNHVVHVSSNLLANLTALWGLSIVTWSIRHH